MKKTITFSLILVSLLQSNIYELEEIEVSGHSTSLVGEAITSSEGIITQKEISQRPLLRSGEILEFVPGMVVTQHSGSGKANQYFLRGFNLDHGTDFRTTVEGMPINMRTHGHGQGYTDLNFIIREFVEYITYEKGPYHVENGDFSTAGSAAFNMSNKLSENFISVELGEHGYLRTVFGDSIQTDNGTLTLGVEAHGNDGPWDNIDEDVRKKNALIRYSNEMYGGSFNVTFMAYDNSWNSADQIPQRAVNSGIISEYGSLDTAVGGESSRYSISSAWKSDKLSISAYAIRSELDLFSNFTYYLDRPANGDQFEQVDERTIYGGEIVHNTHYHLMDTTLYHTSGVQLQYDKIGNVSLHRTQARERQSTIRQDSVDEYSVGVFSGLGVDVTENIAINIGARYDYFGVDVSSDLAQNSGTEQDGLFSLKGGVTYTASPNLEFYLSAGQSFHSNDARGATMHRDPQTNALVDPVDLLVRGVGSEVGVRYFDGKKLNLSLALWQLNLDSELLFVGDAGTTEANRGSNRWGVELAAYYWWSNFLSSDFEFAWNHARFSKNSNSEGNYIAGSLPYVVSSGITLSPIKEFETTLRWRYFGKRTLDSYNNVKSDPFNVFNLNMQYKHDKFLYKLSVLNLFDSRDHDIDYLYESRLQGEALSGYEDIHFHPIEPRTLRFMIAYMF